ncbi:uncharacterized protein LOC134467337 [Engraulis encrasicolus]|uniref:uncharacterized protein LOC134467337 n=1 Tax=Engraulis encrasicolus TaxID=184585 RepID=UPI002FD37670
MEGYIAHRPMLRGVFLISVLVGGVLLAAAGERAVITGNLTLRSQKTCDGNGTWEWLLGEKSDPIITCKRGECDVGARYLKRVQSRSSELHINPVRFGDEGWYIHSCNNVDKGRWSVYVYLDPHRSTRAITAGSNPTINLCSLDQVKLNFTQSGSSSAPETLFIIDNGQVFSAPKATGGNDIAVYAQNDTAVISNMLQDGTFSIIDSKTNKMLCEVTFRVTESSNQGEQVLVKAPPESSSSPPLLIISYVVNGAFLAFILYDKHQLILWLLRKMCGRKEPDSQPTNQEDTEVKLNLHPEGGLENYERRTEVI